MIKRMLKMAKPWWGELVVTVISLLAASLLSLVTPEDDIFEAERRLFRSGKADAQPFI